MTRRDSTAALDSGKPLSTGGAALIVNPDAPNEKRVKLEGVVRIGKENGCEAQLDDAHVSRRHAEVRITTDGVLVRDLGSRNGTHVNGVAVKEALLRPGAVITVGRTDILFDDGKTARAPKHDAGSVGVDEITPGVRRFGDAVAAAPSMHEVFDLLARLAPTDLTVTLLGETGVGKDVLARAVHANSRRKNGPFAVFDCGAVTPSLIESELFGHVKGAFTGATGNRPGAAEQAHKGTLFLDEVGELAIDLQPKLLRMLEQRRVKPVGGQEEIEVDVRVIAATNRDLEEQVKKGEFREDLFFRLSAALVPIPPLRKRLEDLPYLIEACLGDTPMEVEPETVATLEAYDWPGNVRELKNVVAGAAAMADGPRLEPRHLAFFKKRHRAPTIDRMPLGGRPLEVLERAAIKQTLIKFEGNKTKAAKSLGIAASTLYEKIKKYDID